jgi:hypothetical protein
MTAVTRGKARNKLTFVLATPKIAYGFTTRDLGSGNTLGSADFAAIGHMDAAAADAISGVILVISPQSPKPARFRQIVNRDPSAEQAKTLETYGDATTATAINRALAAGWKRGNPGRRCKMTNNATTATVGIDLEGGAIYLSPTAKAQAETYAGALGLQLPGTISATERERCISGCKKPRCAKVERTLSTGGKLTMPCKADKLTDALAAGWSEIRPETSF